MRSISRTLTRSLVATVSVAMGAVLLSAPPASATTSAADEPVVIVQSPVPVITADVGAQLGLVDAATRAAMVLSGVVSVLAFPPSAAAMLPGHEELAGDWDEQDAP